MVRVNKDERLLAIQKEDGSFKRIYKKPSNKSQSRYKEYCYWQNMNTRCNNPNYSKRFPTYVDVSMSTEFQDYNQFVLWCRDQPEFYQDSWVLDKDLLLPKNKIYSRETCCFVPPSVNGFFTFNRLQSNGLPKGVSWCETECKYKSYCAQLDGKNKTLGRFNNPEDAFDAYLDYKNLLAVKLAGMWEGKVSERVYETLKNLDIRDYIT